MLQDGRLGEYYQPVGDYSFKAMIEKNYGVKLGQTRLGRPLSVKSGGVVKH